MATTRWADFVARGLVALAVLCLVGGMGAGVVHRELLDADRFAEHADRVRTDPDVAAALGERITQELLAAEPDLVVIRPLIQASATELAGSPVFGGAFRRAVVPLHTAFVSGVHDDVVLTLADAGAVLVAVVSAASPQLAAKLPPGLDVRLSRIGASSADGRFVSTARTTTVLAWLLPLLALALIAAAALAVRGTWRVRCRAFARMLGVGLLAAAALAAALVLVIDFLAARADRDTLHGAVLAAGWDELDGPAWWTTAMTAAAGYVLCLVAQAPGSLRPRSLASQVGAWLTDRPRDARSVLVRTGVLAVLGLALVIQPETSVRVAAFAAGALLLVEAAFTAAGGLARLRPGRTLNTFASRARPAVPLMAGALAIALLAGLTATGSWPATSHIPNLPRLAPAACNGEAALCSRRYDEVTYPATHNSMSAADQPGWLFAEQPTGVLGQLDDGIRVFLIDSWYGQPTNRPGIVASPDSTREEAIRQATAAFGAAAVESALRLRAHAGLQPRGPIRPYLCHAMCELGAVEWEPLMAGVRRWLDAHPDEVVTFIVQDEVSPEDTASLVERAGLLPYVHTQVAGQPWPTLEEMIGSGRRVVFFLENGDGGAAAPWLMNVNRWVQDTPYDFRRIRDFNCAHFRGRPGASLFLVNHWLDSLKSRVTDAAVVNSEPVLGRRVRECARERGLLPNFVAVDFYDQGDLFGVVDRLNRSGRID